MAKARLTRDQLVALREEMDDVNRVLEQLTATLKQMATNLAAVAIETQIMIAVYLAGAKPTAEQMRDICVAATGPLPPELRADVTRVIGTHFGNGSNG